MRTVSLRVTGRVQGVSFRWATRRTAEALGVVGWVRNRRDGSVEVVATAPHDVVEALVAWCREGPPAARVSGVDVEERDVQTFEGFAIAPTL